jgi:hypothetical protein
VIAGPSAGGVWDGGLTTHEGEAGTDPSEEVTIQLNETGLSKPPLAVRSMMEVAFCPGFTAGG